MWTYAELSIGIFISCLPVIPKFFQNIGPKLSSALTTLKLRSTTKDSASNGSASTAIRNFSERPEAKKVKLPSFKSTFTSIFSSDVEGKEDHEMYTQESLPKREYALLHEESAVPRHDDTIRELG